MHSLIEDGAPHNAEGQLVEGVEIFSPGHAKCECGWISEEFPSRGMRRMAHKIHRRDTDTSVWYRAPIACSVGSKAFAQALCEAGAARCVAAGLTAEADKSSVLITGADGDFSAAQVLLDLVWSEAWESFNVWKVEQKETRTELRKTADGRKQLFSDEVAFLTDAVLNS